MTEAQFKSVVDSYERLVFTICYQFVKDYHRAQDLTQETFLSAYQHIDGYQGTNYKPWLARIAANKAKDYLGSAYQRRVQLTDQEETIHPLFPESDGPEELYIQEEGRSQAEQAIRSLKEPYLQVSILYFLEEKTTDEISLALGRPKRTVETQLYRARQTLRNQLKEEEHHDSVV